MELVVCGVLLSDVDERWEIPQVTISVRKRGEGGRERNGSGNFLRMVSIRGKMGKGVAIGRRKDARGNRCRRMRSVFQSQSSGVRLNVVCQGKGVEKLDSESISRFLENSSIRSKGG